MTTIHQASLRLKRIRKKHPCCTRSLQKCPQKRGIVLKLRVVSPKKPNSARRKIARVRLSNKFVVSMRIIGQGNKLQAYSNVLVCGGRANDLPGVRYSGIKGKLDYSYMENFNRIHRRSKYGISLEVLNYY